MGMEVRKKAPTASMAALALTLALAFTANAHADGADGETTRSLPPETQATVEDIAHSLMQVRDDDTELSCDKAVANARSGLETMIEVGQKNTDDGYMKRSDFEPMAAQLRGAIEEITPEDCATATDDKLAFYRCMSSDYNHVTACAAMRRFYPKP